MSPTELYILYAFLGFICLLLVTIVGILIRQSFTIGSIQGQLTGLRESITGLRESITDLYGRINGLESRIERLEQEMASFREQLAEMRGMIRALHDRMDLLTRHHHDDEGRVVIVPEEVPAAD